MDFLWGSFYDAFMPSQSLEDLKYASERHALFLKELERGVLHYYGSRLAAAAIYGSYARGENTLASDIDFLLILYNTSSRRARGEEFASQIEEHLEPLRESCEAEGIRTEISPLILSSEEASHFLPLYLDMTEHCIVLHDPKHFLEKIEVIDYDQ